MVTLSCLVPNWYVYFCAVLDRRRLQLVQSTLIVILYQLSQGAPRSLSVQFKFRLGLRRQHL